LKRWFWWVTHSRLKPLREFAWALRFHKNGILAYFDLRIDNGIVEAIKNNVKAINLGLVDREAKSPSLWLSIHSLGNLQLPECQHRFL